MRDTSDEALTATLSWFRSAAFPPQTACEATAATRRSAGAAAQRSALGADIVLDLIVICVDDHSGAHAAEPQRIPRNVTPPH